MTLGHERAERKSIGVVTEVGVALGSPARPPSLEEATREARPERQHFVALLVVNSLFKWMSVCLCGEPQELPALAQVG